MVATKLWTVEELERVGWPEGRWELINGESVEMAPSGGDASPVGVMFAAKLLTHVEPRDLGRVYGADGGFVVCPGRELLRVADAAFVAAGRVPPSAHGFPRLAPDLVVEVISPTDSKAEVLANAWMWLAAGVRLVWVADPDERTVTVCQPGHEPRILRASQTLDGGDVLPEFREPVKAFFPQR
jgi:Uma2 family endonuclease